MRFTRRSWMDRLWSSAGIVAPIDPSSEKCLLSGVGGELEGAPVRCPGFIRAAQAPKQVGPCRVIEVVAIEGRGERVDLGEGGFRPDGVAPRDGPVQPGEGRRP